MYLIDYGCSYSYLKSNGHHIQNLIEQNVSNDRNIVFASKHYFSGQTLSRRDDIISIVYNLLFMMDQNDFEFAKIFVDKPYE